MLTRTFGVISLSRFLLCFWDSHWDQ